MTKKRTNIDLLRDRFSRAGYSFKGYEEIMKQIAGGNDRDLQDRINSMDRLAFEDFFRGVVIPSSALLTRDMIRKYPNEAQALSQKQSSLAKAGETWDSDRFKSVLGRKPTRAVVDGKETVVPPSIGRITDQDWINLRKEGLSDEEIAKYVKQFQNEENRERFDSGMKKLKEQERRERESMAKNWSDNLFEFSTDDGTIKRWAKILGNTAIGTGVDVFLPELRAEGEVAIREGRDPNWKKALAKDVGFNTALSLTPIGVGKIVDRLGLKGIKNLGANFTGNLGALFGENLLRQGTSDYYRLDPMSAGAAAMIGATLPAAVSGTLMGVNKYVPALRRYTAPALRRSRGLTESPETREVETFEQSADDVYNYMTHVGNGEAWQQKNAYRFASEKAQGLADRLNAISGRDDFNQGQVMNMLSTRKGLKEMKNMLQAPTPEDYGMMGDEQAARMEAVFPEIMRDIRENAQASDIVGWGVNQGTKVLEDFGGVVEPIREVHGWNRRPSASLDSFMVSNPETVRQWELGNSPANSEADSIYQEWLEKYRR